MSVPLWVLAVFFLLLWADRFFRSRNDDTDRAALSARLDELEERIEELEGPGDYGGED